MYRQAARLLSRHSAAGSGFSGGARPFSADIAAAAAGEDSAFVEAWKKVAPNVEPPKTPLSFMKPRPPTPATIPTKLTVNFVLPYQSEISSKEFGFLYKHNFFLHNQYEIFAKEAESALLALNCSGMPLRALPIRVSPSKTPVRPRARTVSQ